MIYGYVGCQINLDDIMMHLEDKINKQAKLAIDTEITEQMETMQQEVAVMCRQYLKEMFRDWTMENGEGTDFYGDHWRSS